MTLVTPGGALVDTVRSALEGGSYPALALLVAAENVFPPIPSEVIMPVAGVAAGQGRMTYGWVVASGTAGAMLGNIFWYLAARALGIIRLKPIVERWGRWLTVTWPELERAERWFRVNGVFYTLDEY